MSDTHMQSCASRRVCVNGKHACGCDVAIQPLAVTAGQLRALARRLCNRKCGPSLEGYDLVDGLIAAADLIDGKPGPMVHRSSRHADWLKRVPLKSLVKP